MTAGNPLFVALLRNARLPLPEVEYRFHHTRKFRFDYAWPANGHLALEIDGGIWVRGRHSGGAGQIRDMEKGNLAALMGWSVLHVTPQQLCTLSTIDLLKQCFTARLVA
jgi:hypothetical protein